MIVKLLVEGGAMKPGPALSQQLGPAGINMGDVISQVNESTSGFKGLKVPVELDVDTGSKQFEIKVFSPPVSELIKKQINIEKGSGEQLKMQAGNASIEDIISVAKTKFPNMLCKDLKAAVKTVMGTCGSLGVLIESKPAIDVLEHVKSGKYDKEIEEEKTETDPEKRKQLDIYFKETHTAQEKQKQAEEAEAEAAKTAKEEASEQTPVEGEKPEEATPPTAEAEKK